MTLPFVVFRDVEADVVDALCAALPVLGEPNMRVGTRIPTPRPAEFIRVLRVGGPRETVVSEAARISLEAWTGSEARSSELLNRARAILNAQNDHLFGVDEYMGPANLPDPTTDQVRYTASFTVRARAQL